MPDRRFYISDLHLTIRQDDNPTAIIIACASATSAACGNCTTCVVERFKYTKGCFAALRINMRRLIMICFSYCGQQDIKNIMAVHQLSTKISTCTKFTYVMHDHVQA